MVNLYVKKIMAGTYSFSKVPNTWKAQVKAVFDQKLADGLITQEQYDQYINGAGEMG